MSAEELIHKIYDIVDPYRSLPDSDIIKLVEGKFKSTNKSEVQCRCETCTNQSCEGMICTGKFQVYFVVTRCHGFTNHQHQN